MVFVVPHTNTLVVDFGTRSTRAGYAGDFHAFSTTETQEGTVRNSVLVSPELAAETAARHAGEHRADSIVVVEHTGETTESRERMARALFGTKAVGSVLFLKSAVCEAFGFGKTSAMVLSCSAGSKTASAVVGGCVAEFWKSDGGGWDIDKRIQEHNSTDRTAEEVREDIFSGAARLNVSFDDAVSEYHRTIDRMLEMRTRHGMDRRNATSGCIVLAGGMFRSRAFAEMCRSYILDRLTEDHADLVLVNAEMSQSFVGASLFGMNTMSKPLFVTVGDYQSGGVEMLRLKSLERRL